MNDLYELPELQIETLWVGPSEAAELLQQCIVVRKFKNYHIENMAAAMTRDEFVINGEAIIINEMGKVINGKRRLNAIIKAGKKVQMTIIRGVPEGSYHTIDNVTARTPAHTFQFMGYTGRLSGIFEICSRYDLVFRQVGRLPQGSTIRPSQQQIIEEIESNILMREACEYIATFATGNTLQFSRGPLAWAYYRMHCHDADFAQSWVEPFLTGEGLDDNDSREIIRDRLGKATQDCTKRLQINQKLGCVALSWWSLRRGKDATRKEIFRHPIRYLSYFKLDTDLWQV